jgi:hypothetical protein
MNIEYTSGFYKDIDAVGDYLLNNDFNIMILDDIRNKIEEMLTTFPQIGEIYDGDIRKITILRKNVVYYQIKGNKIQLLHLKSGLQEKVSDR